MRNISKKKTLARTTVVFGTPLRQGVGLMFSRAQKGHAYLFPFALPKIVPLTMFFVFTPIDVIYLRKNKVVDLVHSFKPFTNYTPKVMADLVVELPAGTLLRTNTCIGDVIR